MTDPNSTPLAKQLLKKAQRLSLAGSSRLPYTLRISVGSDVSKRRLTLLLTPALNKRLSVYGSGGATATTNNVPSGSGNLPQQVASTPASTQAYTSSYGQLSTLTAPVRRVDSRPLRDKNYQALILKEIYDFCIGNRFEIETGHPITPKTLRQPTQKDFVLLFQFLYGKLDPNYRFNRSVELEVFLLLKNLRYPYLDGINRSAISAVGGQNWPVFLGMLYWLVKINLAMLNLQDDSLVAPDDIFDNIIIKYILSSYTAFIEQKEDYSDYYEQMKTEYEVAQADLSRQLKEKLLFKKEVMEKYNKVNEQFGEIAEAREKSKALQNDLKQFSEYMLKVKERQAQWKVILSKVENDISDADNHLKELEEQKKAFENAIQDKSYSIKEIDDMNVERDKTSRLIDTVSNRIEDLKDTLVHKENEIIQSLQSLQSYVDQYNSMAARIQMTPDDQFHLVINPALLDGESLAFEPDNVLNKLVRVEKIRLLESRSKIKQEFLRVLGETIKVIEQVDHVSEKIFEQQEEIESLETSVAKMKDIQDEIYENMVSDSAIRSAQSERLERDIQAVRIMVNKNVIELETRNKDLKIQLREAKYSYEQKREQLHDKVYSYLQDTISFKLNIQQKLEEVEALTSAELESELESELMGESGSQE